MNPARYCIEHKVVTLVLTTALFVAGTSAYDGMSRLEDPEFTIKDALVVTPYPGATAEEVEQEVTDKIERAVQQLGQLKQTASQSDRGLSTVTVTIKDKYDKATLPQVWDELRRKVADAADDLPPGAGPSIVVDDYGDVSGVFFAVYGDEYSYAELKKVVDLLRRELVLVKDVARVETFGERIEAIYVEPLRDRMAQVGISEAAIIEELRQKNLVADAGRVRVGSEFIAITPTGGVDSVADFEHVLLRGDSEQQIYLRDVARVRRGYVEPARAVIRYDGSAAIGIGISTVSGGNVVTMGEALNRRVRELQAQIPLGIELGVISMQSEAVTTAIQGFVSGLAQAVAIVVVVLLLFMGLRSGLIIGFVLALTICGSFIFLHPMGVALERVSLGALIIALGMLVDNAIVVVDGMLVRIERGEDSERAAVDVVAQSALPLLGATLIAIIAFAAIGTSDDKTGEFCRSLFQVICVSLLLSWVTAITVTPLLGVMFLRPPQTGASRAAPYAGRFYARYRALLETCLRRRRLTLAVVTGMFLLSLQGFGFVDKSFFPPSTRPQFMIDFWLPQGTHIDETARISEEIERYLLELGGVEHATTIVGKGALRFMLSYGPEKTNGAYAHFLVDVDDAKTIDALADRIDDDLTARYPDALAYAYKLEIGPGSKGKIRARISGPDIAGLRYVGERVADEFRRDPLATAVYTDWRQRVKASRPVIAETQANITGIQRADIAHAIRQGFDGLNVGVFRDRDLLLPVILRAPAEERGDVNELDNLQIWSPAAGKRIPLRQVVSRVDVGFEDEIIMRRDRRRTITVMADTRIGPASRLFERLRPKVEAIELPAGYTLEWGGEYEDSRDAQGPLYASLPVFIAIMVLILIALFNSIRKAMAIFLCVPLALMGVTAGLLLTNQPFSFTALLGLLSLSGMLIKNAVVLVDEIEVQRRAGRTDHDAIMISGVSRLRPVAMAASTTALGMIPLLFDAFFTAMAVTIISGLVFATALTMFVVPVLYATFFSVHGGAAR